MFDIPDTREAISFKVKGAKITLRETQFIANDVGVPFKDVGFKNGILTVYVTTPACRLIAEENSLPIYIAMSLDIPVENITKIEE